MKELFAFASELFGRSAPRRIMFIDMKGTQQRWYDVQAQAARRAALIVCGVLVLVPVLFVVFTPVRNLIPGYGTESLRSSTIAALMRVQALQDSVDMQIQYVTHLQQILTGQVDSTLTAPADMDEPLSAVYGPLEVSDALPSDDWSDHEQPAVFLERFSVRPASMEAESYDSRPRPPSMLLPAITPVSGYTTQPFNARTGHYGLDIATEEGKIVRSIGEGHVIFSDWTHSGGNTIIVQHADGFITVYKHNQRLLKDVADRVQLREGVAVSGNTGQLTTGPHLHFEIWNNGLAQDPRPYLLGL